MIPPGMKNPFLHSKADDTITLPAGNIPQLHANVLDKCGEMIHHASNSGHGVGLIVIGEAGSGKSHLIAQLRQQLVAIPSTILIAIRMKGAYTGCLWRHLRRRVVEELLREYDNKQNGGNGLLRILRNQFPQWARSIEQSPGGLLDWLIGRSQVKTSLQPYLQQFSRASPLDYSLTKVLAKIGSADSSELSTSWLRGEQLGPDDQQQLGLAPSFPSEHQQETDAREVVLSLLRLAGNKTLLYFCFDEVETLQAGNWDSGVLREFTTLATDLLTESGQRVVSLFLRPNLYLDIGRAVEVSNLQKLGQFSARIPPLTWEQTIQIIFGRLEAEPDCRKMRAARPNEKFWPLTEKFVLSVYQQHRRSITPRHAILACAVEFQDSQGKSKATTPRSNQEPSPSSDELPSLPPTTRTTFPAASQMAVLTRKSTQPESYGEKEITKTTDFHRAWVKLRKKFLADTEQVPFDSVMGISIPWLIDALGVRLDRVQTTASQFSDLNLYFLPHAPKLKSVGISLCNQDPRHLWRRLDRLYYEWIESKSRSSTTVGRLVILRFIDTKSTPAAKERLEKLTKAGVIVLLVQTILLAELSAFHSMLTAANTGEMTRGGLPVDSMDFTIWAKDNLSTEIHQFIDEITGLSTVS